MALSIVSIDGEATWLRTDAAGNPAGSGVDFVPVVRFWQENRPDRVRTRKPEGWLYPKGYELSMLRTDMAKGFVSYILRSDDKSRLIRSGRLGSNMIGGPQGNWPALTSTEIGRAEIKALQKLKEQKVNLGVAFAETQQTADLIGSSASRIGRSFSHLTHGRPRAAAQALGLNPRQAPNHWLELQYGWKPLLSDVFGAVDSLQRLQSEHWVVTAKGSYKDGREQTMYFNNSATNCLRKESGFSGVFVRLDYEPGNTFLSSLANVGLTNPLEVLWEKVPYSFIVDWFVPIGGWLGSMDAAYGWKFKSGSCTLFRKKYVYGKSNGPSGYIDKSDYAGSERYIDLKRTVYTSSPLPSFPGIKNPVSLVHAANGLSLLASAFGRSSPRGVR
jgi:hypothetical protein